MKKTMMPALLPTLWLSALVGVGVAAVPLPACAQSAIGSDPSRDQQIIELREEIKQLEHRVDTLQGLDHKVQVIDRKLEVQSAAEQAQVKREQDQAKNAPVIKAGAQGFSFASPNDDWRVEFHGSSRATAAFSPTAPTKLQAHSI